MGLVDGKQKYKIMLDSVKQMINNWDPYSLIEGGAPEDEFETEIARILAGLPSCNSADDVAKLISLVFGESFEKESFFLVSRF